MNRLVVKSVEDSCLKIVGDESLLFHESAQKIYHLNTAATCIWCLLEDLQCVDKVIAQYNSRFAAPDQNSNDTILAMIADWQNAGLLENSLPSPTRVLPRKKVVDPPTVAPERFLNCCSQMKTYSLLDTSISIRYATRAQFNWVHPIFAHLEAFHGEQAGACIELLAEHDSHLIYRDGKYEGKVECIDRLGPTVKGLLLQRAINDQEYFLFVHAGVVARNGKGLMLPGRSGSGKSTLTAALIKSGFQYYSDEIALLQEVSFNVKPTPIAIGIKSSGWPVLMGYYPELGNLSVHHREDGKQVKYLPPPEITRAQGAVPALAVGMIVFPRYQSGVKTELRYYSQIDALREILDDCLALPKGLCKANFIALVDWIVGVECFELYLSDLDLAVEALSQAFDGQPGWEV